MTLPYQPILCLDFDGVLHSYTSGWKGADKIPDPPVAGAMEFLDGAVYYFNVCILSSRSHHPGGIPAMHGWLKKNLIEVFGEVKGVLILDLLEFPVEKPPAMVTLDDRALTFDGSWPDLQDLLKFKPWNKR